MRYSYFQEQAQSASREESRRDATRLFLRALALYSSGQVADAGLVVLGARELGRRGLRIGKVRR